MRTPRRPRGVLLLRTAIAAAAAAAVLVAGGSAAAAMEDWAEERTARAGTLAADLAQCDAWVDAQDWQQWFDNACEETIAAGVNSGATDAWLPEGGGARTTPGWSISRYSIYYDGGGISAVDRKIRGAATSWVWTAATYALRMAVWAMDWVAAGRITDIIGVIPIEVGDFLHREIVVGLQLRHLALTVMGVVSAWAIVRRRIAEAVGNMAFALAALALGAFVLANLAGYYHGARSTKALLVEAVLAADETGSELNAAAMTAPLMDGVIHVPWENLNFGRSLAGDCEIAAGVDILNRAPSSEDHYPRHRIKSCPDGRSLDTFNRYPTASRLFGAIIVAFGQMAVALLIGATALIGLTAELLLAAAFATFPVVAVAVAFPGGRSVAASWVSMLLRGIVGLAAGVLGLRLVVVVMTAVAANSENLAFFERFAVFSLVAFAGWRMRKLIPQAAAKISATLGGKAAAAGSGSGTPAGAALTAGAGGAIGGAAGGLAAGAVASQLLPAHSAGAATRAARRAATKTLSGTRRVGRGARRVASGATGLAATAAQASGSEGAGTRLLSSTKAGQRAAHGGGLATAAAAAAGHAMARRNNMAAAASGALDETALHELAHGPSRRGQIVVAQHHKTAQADIDHLASGIDAKVVKAAAPRASAELAHGLASSHNRSIRKAAAGNENLTPQSAQQIVTKGRTRGPYQPPPSSPEDAAGPNTGPKTGTNTGPKAGPDAGPDTGGPNTGPQTGTNTGPKAGPDAGPDTGPKAGPDAGPDTGPKARPDAGPNAGPKARPNAGPDAGPNTGTDPGPSTGPKAGPNTGPDTGPKAGPNTGPDTGPKAGPNTGPKAGPNTGPDTGPKAGPNTGPKAGPNTGRNAGPRTESERSAPEGGPGP